MTHGVDWLAARAAFEREGAAVSAIAARFGTSERSVRRRVRAERWARPGTAPQASAGAADAPPDPAALVRSLQRATAALVAAAEARARGRGEEAVEEREVKALAALAAMLAKVFDLTPEPGDPRAPADPADLDFDDPRQRDALSASMERLVGPRAAGAGPGDVGLDAGAARDLLAALRAGGPVAP
jgi:transposase-like protein